MDTDIKKEEDIKTEPKGIKSHLEITIYRITFAINIRDKEYNYFFYLENEKDEKVNPTNEETKKDGGANP